MSAFSKIFGSHSERELKRIYPIADKVESYKEAMGKLSDEELKDKTREFKKRLEDGATLDDILPEAFATVREAAKRVLGMEHYRVQIIGGIICIRDVLQRCEPVKVRHLFLHFLHTLMHLRARVCVLSQSMITLQSVMLSGWGRFMSS